MAKRILSAFIIISIFALSGCSASKDSIKNRAYHNMTSWFNALFNGQQAMDQRLNELENTYQDDYFQTLRVEPYAEFEMNDNPDFIETPPMAVGRGSGSQFQDNQNSAKTGFAKAEEKALKVISNHSMNIRGQERNKLIARAYLMLGQARYYQGKPFQALDALQQVQALPFDKHTENAKYYTALSQIQAGNRFAAMEILDELYDNDDIKRKLKADVSKQLAWIYYLENEPESALNGLDQAIKYTRNRNDKARLNFIQGQILTELGKFDEANARFQKSFKLKPGFEMEARSQVAIASNFDPVSHDYNVFKNRLMKMANTGTYETYRNEFYYALGLIEEKRDSIKLAEQAYLRALREEASDPRFRAETYAALGKLKFDLSDYIYAGAYYDSAITTIGEGPRKVELTRFTNNLKSVIDKYYLVQRNDSILRITTMSDAEKNSFFNDYIEKLKVRDEQLQREEEQATQFLTQTRGSSFGFGNEQDRGKFYFYSNAAKNSGESEFRRIWGDRTLRDNWRISVSGSTFEDQRAELTGISNTNDPRRYELDFYLEQIPTSAKAINDLKMQRDTTELSLGMDYYDKFDDYALATTTLEHLISTPPKDENVLLRAYYNLYRMNADNNVVISEKYKNLVLNEFPNTIYAEFILNPEADFSEENSPEVLALYLETFDAYKAEEYELVKEKSSQAFEEFPLSKIIAKFALLNTFADAALEGEEKYREGLERILVVYAGTSEAKHAQHLLDQLNNKGKTPVNTPLNQPPQNLPENRAESRNERFEQQQKLEEKRIEEQKNLERKDSNREIQGNSPVQKVPSVQRPVQRSRDIKRN